MNLRSRNKAPPAPAPHIPKRKVKETAKPLQEFKTEERVKKAERKRLTAFEIFQRSLEVEPNSVASNLLRKPPVEKESPHLNIPAEHTIYQADILYLPKDDHYKYALVVVDVATGVTEIEPLKTKEASETTKAFQSIFKRKLLPKPSIMMQVDQGSEFKSVTKTFFDKEKIIVRYAKAGRSRQQAMAENRNGLIARMIALIQTNEELITNEPARAWVRYIPQIKEAINKALTRKPYAPSEAEANLPECDKCDLLDEGTRVRVKLDKPQSVLGEKLSGYTFRATDIRYSPEVHTITQAIIKPDNPFLYKVSDIPHTAYTRSQLLVVNEEAEPKKELQNKFVVEKLLDKRKAKNRVEYLVKWVGYTSKDNTWEPRAQLANDLGDSLKIFEKKLEEEITKKINRKKR